MEDKTLEGFLDTQLIKGMALAESSDLLELTPLPGTPPQHYVARFRCRGLVRSANGRIEVAQCFDVGITLDDEYLVSPDPMRVLTWLSPPPLAPRSAPHLWSALE